MNRALRSALFGVVFSLIVALGCAVAAGKASHPLASANSRGVISGAINATIPFTDAVVIYLPAITTAAKPVELPVDIRNKADVLAFLETYHETAPAAEMGWTGNRDGCVAGTTLPGYRQSLQDLVNFFRAMAGVPAQVTFLDEYNAKVQQAALMMSVNEQVEHYPPDTWECYTVEGAEAAAASNLSIWNSQGPEFHGIKAQMEDDGVTNYAVGHRRWMLCPATKYMGTGDVPEEGNNFAANALWVKDESSRGPRPALRNEFIAWPPSGFVPDDLVYERWSFMLRDADFSNATVNVRYQGNNLPVRIALEEQGFCENTLVWTPDIDLGQLNPNEDHRFDVEIGGVLIDGTTRTFTYDVIVFIVN